MSRQTGLKQASDWLDLLEGFKSNDKNDRGGLTIRGHTQKDLDAYLDERFLPRRPISTITDEDIDGIRLYEYWLPLGCEPLPAPVDWLLFQWGFLQRSAAPLGLQRVTKQKEDGNIGPVTVAAVINADPACVASLLLDEQVAHLRRLVERSNERMKLWIQSNPEQNKPKLYLDDQREFMLGWVNRCARAASLCRHDWKPMPEQREWAMNQDADFEAGNPPTLT